MPDSESEGWQELQTESRRRCPKLFYSFSTKKESLTLLLTDLISIWECSLDKYDILAAAARQQTSIDPSVSSDQFEILLSKIRKSLSDGENSINRDGRGNSQALLLRTKIALPRPLRPLEWTFTLDLRAASELAERILRPSLHEVFVSQNKINSLLGIIKDKDHVISRLLERVGNSAVDLSLVFPGITGFASRKGGHVSVADAKKHVPGMSSFDEKSWTTQFANNDGYEGADRTGLTNLVRGCEKCFVHTRAEHESWVKDLPSMEIQNLNAASKNQLGSPSTSTGPVHPDFNLETTDDEFERQATPPHLKSKGAGGKRAARAATDDEETEEDELAPQQAQSSAIGGLGRRNATKAFGASMRSPESAPCAKNKSPSRRRASTASTATATASEDNDADNEGPQPPTAPQSRSSHSTQKSKLGVLRPRRISPTPSPSSLAPPAPKSRSPTSSGGRGYNEGPTPHNSRAPRVSITLEEEEVTDDHLDPASTSFPSPSPPPKAKPATPAHERCRLGRLGGRKQVTPLKSTSPEPQETPKGDETPETLTPTRRKLGRLGGPRKSDRETTTTISPKAQDKAGIVDDSSNATNSPSPLASSSRQKLLGVESGGHRGRQASRPSTRKEPVVEEETKQKETAEEAAGRRRMELKRTIAATDGGKKKRRF
ncbi:uncharacterized protein Z519_09277 [Cladophialophora bantiana CBS 173.52]|uniref:Non-homologous end-joining factor 1 n=1 Tax=Cladophialophora bantiana (strain ATCC 10958 / CBS 173.52 / CDC B-1940 / NIH 8579) TaxID=1442370 RepID=A0A0D2H992_CLAB1|nr:uncharacterized protein Z519_09277 [Cladophialophora bantiana CBS 173.52]KIW89848.1 hypothetical protein Z519_09277 [Cladophialophora bantiana CBS 173.52]